MLSPRRIVSNKDFRNENKRSRNDLRKTSSVPKNITFDKTATTPMKAVEQIHRSHVCLGQKLGSGSYADVYEIFWKGPHNQAKKHCALKCLSSKTRNGLQSNLKAAAIDDLIMESNILKQLDHENIITVQGVCAGGPTKAFTECDLGYYLILDLLPDTLSNQLNKCRKKYNIASKRPMPRRKIASLEKFKTKLLCTALSVAKAMEYLQQQKIVLRDLKPDNIGFDEDGIPKLFDFGFARQANELKESEIVGTLQYMAPEIAIGMGAQLKSDVYSFGIMLWELCTMEKPFDKEYANSKEFMEDVIYSGNRPSLSKIKSASLRNLIASCWSTDPSNRPDFSKISAVLQLEVAFTCGRLPGQIQVTKTEKALSESTGLDKVKSRNSYTSSVSNWRKEPDSAAKKQGFSKRANSWLKKTSNSFLPTRMLEQPLHTSYIDR